ncbi:hypothetical protein EES44_01760 [Streptomyces sp. ADI96-15]|nr:hypothetical protein EES44_01760 [Streptomyces sp. ADI96-15]
MTRLIFVGPTPAPVQAPPAVGLEEVTKGYVPWSTSSRVPWPPSKRTTLSSSSAWLRMSVVSATYGRIASAWTSISSTIRSASTARRL